MEYLDRLVESYKTLVKPFMVDDEKVFPAAQYKDELHMHNLICLCKKLHMGYFRKEWDGNEYYKPDYDIVWINYKGIKFFELVARKKETETVWEVPK